MQSIRCDANDDLYVTCPQCGGDGFVTAIVEQGNGWTPSLYGNFPCPLCTQARTIHRDYAEQYRRDMAEKVHE